MNDSQSLPKGRIAQHISDLPKSGIRDFFELVLSMDDVMSLGVGEPDFATPWGIRETAISALEKGHTSYTSNLGLLSLREEICKYVEVEFGEEYNPEKECIITVGVSEALDLALRALINPGDEIIYHEPCYVSYGPVIKMAHGVPVPVITEESENFQLHPEKVRAAITDKTKAIVLNFPNNPTGANLTLEQKKELAAIAIEYNLIVLTDEIYAELTYDEGSISIAALPGMRDRTLLLHGFSKAYAMTGFRVGFACGPADLVDAMMKIHQYTMLCAPINGQEAAIEALRNGRKDMELMKAEYYRRRNYIVNRFNQIGLKCRMPEGAFYAYPNIEASGLTSEEFAHKLLREEKVAVVPATAFCTNGHKHIRCSYATSMDTIQKALDGVERFMERRKAKN